MITTQEVNKVVISSTQAKARFSEFIDRSMNGEEIVVHRRGRPVAVILSYEEYQRLQTLREKARREEALAQLRALARAVQEKNQDLSQSERDALARELVDEAVGNLEARGAIRFEEG